MANWQFSIMQAIRFFPMIAFYLTIPFMIFQYRKYGTIPFMRFLCVYSFAFYMLCVYFLVVLPLPKWEAVAALTTPRYNLHLFQGYSEIATIFDLHNIRYQGLKNFLLSWSGLEPLFNIIMTIPFGFYMRYYFKKSFPKTFLFSFGLTLFLELTQLSGLYGIYPRPYRLFDVNDLFNNTLGGVIGWAAAPLLMRFLPTRDKIDETARMRTNPQNYVRRATAFLIDTLAFGIAAFPLSSLSDNGLINWLINVAAYTGIFGLITYRKKGKTIGKWTVGLQLADSRTGEAPTLRQCLVRAFFVYGIFFDFHLSGPDKNAAISNILFYINLIPQIVIAVNLILAWKKKDKVLFYEKLTHVTDTLV